VYSEKVFLSYQITIKFGIIAISIMTQLFSLLGTIGAYHENCFLTIICAIFTSFNFIWTFLLSSFNSIDKLWLFAALNAMLSIFAYLFGQIFILHERQTANQNITNFAEFINNQSENIHCEPPHYEAPPAYNQLSFNQSKIDCIKY
jgi:hypothetical protein